MTKAIDELIQLKTDELHFIQAALNNLDLVKVAQESQKEDGWSNFTSNVIRDLKDRAVSIERHIRSLKQERFNFSPLEEQLGALAKEAPMSKCLSWD